MRKKFNYNTKFSLVNKSFCFFIALLLCCNAFAQEANNTEPICTPQFNPCDNVNVLDFSQPGIDWRFNSTSGSYTVGEQTFDINLIDPDGIFAPLQPMVDPDDDGSYENNTGLAIGINPKQTNDELEITYNLSLISDYVAFTIRDLDRKYYGGSEQIERVCVVGYLDGVEVLPSVSAYCGNVEVSGNCAVGTTSSSFSEEDESIRVVFESCINEIKIFYGNDSSAADDPTYSRIYIGDDIGFGTAVCTDACKLCTAEAAEIAMPSGNTERTICIDDEIDEPIDVTVSGGSGENSAWVITDQEANILGLPVAPPFVLDGAGEGTCLIWYLSWDGDLANAPAVGENASAIVDDSFCAQLSNPISVKREVCCTAEAATIDLVGSDASICIDDEIDEPIDVTVSGGSGENSAWVITDQEANILGLPVAPPFVLDGAGEGTCLIWYLSWDGDLANAPAVGENASAIVDDSFCAKLSNPVSIIREVCCTAEAATIDLVGSDASICIDDEIDEPIDVTVSGGSGENSAWVITDQEANILGLPVAPPFVLDGAGEGTCLIWYLSWDGDLANAPAVGENASAIVDDSFCAKLSNPVSIIREVCCTAEAATIDLVGSVSSICIDDEINEPIDVAVNGGSGENSAWVITDQEANILAMPDAPPFVLDGAGEGTCLIWYLNWDGDLSETPAVGANASTIVNNSECAVLSNSIPIVRETCCTAASAEIAIAGGGDSFDLCVNDETLDLVQFEVLNAGNGENNAWVITDGDGIILELFEDAPNLDFYGGTEGTCLIWYLNWDGDLASVPQIGDSAVDLVSNSTCAELSNAVTITRTCCCPYSIEFVPDNLTCISGVLFPRATLVTDTNLILPGDSLVCNIEGFSFCSGSPSIRNADGDVVAGAVTLPGEYTATGCDCAEDVRLEISQDDIDNCEVVQQSIVAPSICNGGMLAEAPIVNSVFNNSATIQWSPQTNASLQYKAVDSNRWISVSQRNGYVIIPNLGTCKEYEVRLNYPCGNNVITSLNQRFTTAGCVTCADISPQLVPLNVTDNSAILSWDVVSGSMYTLYYKTDDAAEWKTYNTVVPFVVLFGLDECSMYEFGLKVTCANARASEMSPIVEFGNNCGGQRNGSLVITDNSLINIYPNPASSFVDISLTNNATMSSIEIYNVSGKLLFNENSLNFDGMKYTAQLTDLPNGLYFVTSVVESKVHTKKFLKE